MKELLAQSGNYVYDRRPWPVQPEEEKNENINNTQKAYTELLVVYPNPTGAKLTVEIRAVETEGVLIIKDLLGRSLYQHQVGNKEKVVFLDIEHFIPGIYILQFVSEKGQSIAVKVVKQ
jgi:hypothetical protein